MNLSLLFFWCDLQKIEKITNITSIRSSPSSEKYLNFPTIKVRVKHSDFGFTLNKLNQRLNSWKNTLLNKAGRTTLATSVLNFISIYYICKFLGCLNLSVIKLIKGLETSFERVLLTRAFIWWVGILSQNQTNMVALVLGIKAREANIAMLGKLVWDIQQNSNKLWVNLLKSKYCKNGQIGS